jgi:hypothetical protein
LKQHVGMKN